MNNEASWHAVNVSWAARVFFFATMLCYGTVAVQADAPVTMIAKEGTIPPAGVAVGGHAPSYKIPDSASRRYLVVDLSSGQHGDQFPVSWLDCDPDEGWTDEYKTSKLVLRKINPGAFIMGEDRTNSSHRVVFTRSYFIGVFEVTRRQWELVMGSTPSKFKDDNVKMPVESVSYDMIRGSGIGAEWPKGNEVDADSFLGIVRARTGLRFDLPTEQQWEYACSAGTESEYFYGKDPDGRYMWYRGNSGGHPHEVGLTRPNQWGLFDMHGNVSEWCLNWNSPAWYGIDPRGFSFGSFRIKRGGNWLFDEQSCTTFSRGGGKPSGVSMLTGFRLLLELGDAGSRLNNFW